MIYITGDVHGTHSIMSRLNIRNFPQQKQMNKHDYVIIAGDFGLIWNHDKEDLFWLKWLDRTKPFTTLFIDGNHENFELLEQYPVELWNGGYVHKINDSVFHLMRGQVFELEGLTFFTFGGAASHDRQYRTPGKSWWSREMPSAAEYEYGTKKLDQYHWNVDHVITHTCSQSSLNWLQHRYEIQVEEDDMHLYFQTLQEKLNYKTWWFGHFHQDVELPHNQRLLYHNIVLLNNKRNA